MTRISKVLLLTSLLMLVGCGPSQQEIDSIGKATCNMLKESLMVQGTFRLEKVNDARRELGEPLFIGEDDEIVMAYKNGQCEALVKNDPSYHKFLKAKAEREETMREIRAEIAEEKRVAEARAAEEKRVAAEKRRAEMERERLALLAENKRQEKARVDFCSKLTLDDFIQNTSFEAFYKKNIVSFIELKIDTKGLLSRCGDIAKFSFSVLGWSSKVDSLASGTILRMRVENASSELLAKLKQLPNLSGNSVEIDAQVPQDWIDFKLLKVGSPG
ncbi:hypothetical protein N9U55_01255 [Luminiphilus sp.]|nr:hypothetical protein [Luminiphilus sp.]MDA9721888.1 hypothetical protein [Luminiphilus sp.]